MFTSTGVPSIRGPERQDILGQERCSPLCAGHRSGGTFLGTCHPPSCCGEIIPRSIFARNHRHGVLRRPRRYAEHRQSTSTGNDLTGCRRSPTTRWRYGQGLTSSLFHAFLEFEILSHPNGVHIPLEFGINAYASTSHGDDIGSGFPRWPRRKWFQMPQGNQGLHVQLKDYGDRLNSPRCTRKPTSIALRRRVELGCSRCGRRRLPSAGTRCPVAARLQVGEKTVLTSITM